MVIHKCNKEVEIATMAEKIIHIEKKVDLIDTKLSTFIDAADHKYATKEEVSTLKDSVREHKSNTKEWIMWVPTIIIILIELLKLGFTGKP